MDFIEIENVSRSFTRDQVKLEVLKEINLSVKRGQVVAITGQNGAGKTTLFRILNTLILPDTGVVKVDGNDTKDAAKSIRSMVAWSSGQEGGFFNRFTGLENLYCFAAMDEVSKDKVDIHLKLLSSLTPLQKALGTPYFLCSAGMKQCLGIAKAVCAEKPILLLDEPTRSLDRETAKEVRELIHKLKGEYTIIFSTHRDEDLDCADVIFDLEDGCLNKLN